MNSQLLTMMIDAGAGDAQAAAWLDVCAPDWRTLVPQLHDECGILAVMRSLASSEVGMRVKSTCRWLGNGADPHIELLIAIFRQAYKDAAGVTGCQAYERDRWQQDAQEFLNELAFPIVQGRGGGER